MIFINTWWVGGHEPIRLPDISKFKIHRYSFDPRFLKEFTQEKIEVKIFFRELLQNTLWWHFKSFDFSGIFCYVEGIATTLRWSKERLTSDFHNLIVESTWFQVSWKVCQ